MKSTGGYAQEQLNLLIRQMVKMSAMLKDRFYSPISFTDPFGAKTSVVYDTETFNGVVRNSDGYYLTIQGDHGRTSKQGKGRGVRLSNTFST